MPICAFDIHLDGTASPPTDTALTGNAAYRWWHFDLSDPELEDWAAKTLPEIPAAALRQSETRPRCDAYADGLILNLRGINMNEGQPADQMVSIRMWVTAGAIVTVRMRKIFAIDEIRQQTLAGNAPPTVAAFTTSLISKLTHRIQDEVLKLGALTEFYEADLEDTETEQPKDLQVSRRSVIKLRRYLAPQQTALTSLSQSGVAFIPQADALQLRELTNRTTIAVEELNALQERIIAVQEEHDVIIAGRQADHSYRLSLAAGIFLPLGFLTGLFGVNIAGMPGLENPMAFVWLCLAMTGLAIALTILLKFMRWL